MSCFCGRNSIQSPKNARPNEKDLLDWAVHADALTEADYSAKVGYLLRPLVTRISTVANRRSST
jgi:hypothetical protein